MIANEEDEICMTTSALKLKLEKSLEAFAVGIFLSTLLLFITVVLKINLWVYCFIPSLFMFSAIGAGIVTRSLVAFTRLKGKPIINAEEFEEKFTGSAGVNSMFWVIVVIIALLVFLFTYIKGINLFNFRINAITVVLFLFDAVLLCWGMYNIVSQLSFVIFFISIIPTMFDRDDTERHFYKKINDTDIISYDTDKNLKKLIKKYNERIMWLEMHMNAENEKEYKAKKYIYETCLRDIADILNKLDV